MLAVDLFDHHDDLDDWAKAFGAADPSGRAPVLGPHRPVHDVVAALTGPDRVRPDPDPTGTLVVSPRSSAFGPLAAALADRVGGTLCRPADPADLARIPAEHPAARYVLLVAQAAEIGDAVVRQLHDHLWAGVSHGDFRGHLGVVTCATAEQAAWLVTKGMLLARRGVPQRADLRVWPAFDSVPARYGTGTWVLRPDATAHGLGPMLTREHSGVVSFIAHGRDDVIHLHDTVICAAGPEPVALRGDTRPDLPVCAYTGRCFRGEIPPGQIVRSSGIVADVVFSNACMGWRVADGLFPADYLLPTGFAAGPTAVYVGAPNLVNGVAALNDVFHAACGAGASVGAAASAVNDHLRYDRGDLPYFTVLGLPWLTTAGAGTEVAGTDGVPVGELTVAPGGGEGAGGTLAAAARGIGAARDTGRPRHVVLTSPRSAPVLAGAAVSRPDAEGELLRLRTELTQLGRAMVALEQVPMLGFRYARQGNLMVTLRDQVAALSGALHQAVSFGDVGRVAKRVGSLRKAVQRAEAGLAAALWERGTTSFVNFDDMWGEVLEQRPPVPTDQPCPYCGREVVRLDADHPLFPDLARNGLVCSRCCMLFDRDGRGPVEAATLECPPVWRRGETVDIVLRLTCAADRTGPVTALVGIHTEACDRNRVGFEGVTTVTLPPGGTVAVPARATVHPDAHMHQEYLRGFVVAEGTITVATRPLYVRPAA